MTKLIIATGSEVQLALHAQAEAIEARWGLPAGKWLRVFKAIEK